MAQGRFGGRPNSGSNPMVFVMGFFFLLFSIMGGALLYMSLNQRAPAPVVAEDSESSIEMVDVLIPFTAIKPGIALEPGLFKVEARPSVNVSSKVVRDIEQIKGMFSKVEIPAAEPLHSDHLTDKKPTSDIVSKIPRGFRAITITVDATTSVEGWAGPGAKVDVVWISNNRGEQVAKVIVEAAKILSYSGQTSRPDGAGGVPPSTATLLVTKEDATIIQLAQTSGRLTLQLRNDDDGDISGDGAVNISTIMNTSQDETECREARHRGITKMPKPNGEYVEMVLNDRGVLVPLETFCKDQLEAAKKDG